MLLCWRRRVHLSIITPHECPRHRGLALLHWSLSVPVIPPRAKTVLEFVLLPKRRKTQILQNWSVGKKFDNLVRAWKAELETSLLVKKWAAILGLAIKRRDERQKKRGNRLLQVLVLCKNPALYASSFYSWPSLWYLLELYVITYLISLVLYSYWDTDKAQSSTSRAKWLHPILLSLTIWHVHNWCGLSCPHMVTCPSILVSPENDIFITESFQPQANHQTQNTHCRVLWQLQFFLGVSSIRRHSQTIPTNTTWEQLAVKKETSGQATRWQKQTWTGKANYHFQFWLQHCQFLFDKPEKISVFIKSFCKRKITFTQGLVFSFLSAEWWHISQKPQA